LFPSNFNVSSATINRLLDRLDEAKQAFSKRGRVAIERALVQLNRSRINDAETLVRYHETLLFLRAYPQSAMQLKLTEAQLSSFAQRVQKLREAGADLSPLEHPEISGIAGTAVTDTFSYYIVRWLVRLQPGRVALDSDWVEDEYRLGATWPRFMPLLEEDALVEANVPYRKWLREARPRSVSEIQWLMERFASLRLTDKEKAELYDSLKLYVRWQPAFRATRTGMRLPVRKIFYHREPLIKRKDVSLTDELQRRPLPLTKLSRAEGEKILNLTRKTSTLRYRELYGFTHGDPARLLKASIGRGVDLFIMGVPAGKRLPLRAYHAAMIFKNGVPVGYFEGLSFCERMESGFNFYYTFREGETAWIYARTLSVFKQLLGVTAFSIDPYQIGFENEEGIESGAFWFYRKLGFRPTESELLKLTLLEEKKIANRPGYRTRAPTLRRLAAGYMIFEMSEMDRGAWDRFQIREIGFAVQRRMARDFGGDAEKIRGQSLQDVTRALSVHVSDWKAAELSALSDLALVLVLIPDLDRWSKSEKEQVAMIIRAKAGPNESNYLRSLQRHRRLRSEIIRLGS
jgi:hypothetical protein